MPVNIPRAGTKPWNGTGDRGQRAEGTAQRVREREQEEGNRNRAKSRGKQEYSVRVWVCVCVWRHMSLLSQRFLTEKIVVHRDREWNSRQDRAGHIALIFIHFSCAAATHLTLQDFYGFLWRSSAMQHSAAQPKDVTCHTRSPCQAASNYTPRSAAPSPLRSRPGQIKYLHATLECSTHGGFVRIHNSLTVYRYIDTQILRYIALQADTNWKCARSLFTTR